MYKFLNNKDKAIVQLSTAATYCELEWEWPLEADKELAQQITQGIAELLNSRECRQACIYLPSLCKRAELMSRLINDENLKKLVELCNGAARVDKSEEETTGVPFHGAHALSMLMKRASTLSDLCDRLMLTAMQRRLHQRMLTLRRNSSIYRR